MFESEIFIVSEDKIDRSLIDRFYKYDEDYILKIINELRRKNILTLHNSFSGWNNFVNDYIVKIIKETIKRQTLVAKQRLSFMKYYSKVYNDFDLPKLICDQIDPQLIIHKVDEL